MVEMLQEAERASLETLRYRTSPDFLFNALNSVESLSRRAPGLIPELVRGLSGCLRYWLRPAQDGWATLQQELDAVACYLQVEKVRFEDQFEVVFEIAEAARRQRVPQFFLQTLVENVVREGLGAGPAPLRVVVNCRCLGRALRIELRHTGVGFRMATAPGSGLEDLHRPLDLLCGEDGYGWTLIESADWVSLTIEIPLASSAAGR
jgi:LytS/YehU family sensor histidine kinase